MQRDEFLEQLKQVYGKDPSGLGKLIETMDFDLLQPEDFTLLEFKHFEYYPPEVETKLGLLGRWTEKGRKLNPYNVDQYKSLYYRKYFDARLKTLQEKKDLADFKKVVREYFRNFHRYYSDANVDHVMKTLMTLVSLPAYSEVQSIVRIKEFRNNMEKAKGRDVEWFGKLLKDMDFSLLTDADFGEIELHHFQYERADYNVGKFYDLFESKRAQVRKS